MPTSYVKKVAKDLKLPESEVEDYWSKAKEIATERFDPKQKGYWSYVMGIFKNMLSISASDEALLAFTSESARNSKWWEGLTNKQQKAYIKEHPKSKYAKMYKAKVEEPKAAEPKAEEPEPISEKDQAVARNIVQMNEDKIEEGIEDDLTEHELDKGLEVLNSLTEEPEEEPSKDLNADEEEDDDLSDLDVPDEEEEEDTEPNKDLNAEEEEDTEEEPEKEEPTNDLNADEEEDNEPTEEEPEQDLNADEEEDTEEPEPESDADEEEPESEPEQPEETGKKDDKILTPENIKIAKAVVGSLAKNVLGALAVALLFTPLLPLALEIGDMYWKYLQGEAEEDDEDYEEEEPIKKKKKQVRASARKDTKFFINHFTEWLLKQDIKKLAAKK